MLGRRGYVSLNHFDKKHDKVAEYGLMGLILGGAGIAAVAKVGFLAKLGGKRPSSRLPAPTAIRNFSSLR